jgi:hypothetical protein
VTGSSYDYQRLTITADRQRALPQIEALAQAGEPVPLNVRSWSAAHQRVIEDYRNGELEIHNPWADTQWVPTQQSIDGQLSVLTDVDGHGGLPDPYGVALPQQRIPPNRTTCLAINVAPLTDTHRRYLARLPGGRRV